LPELLVNAHKIFDNYLIIKLIINLFSLLFHSNLNL